MDQESCCADESAQKSIEKYSDMVYRLSYSLVKNKYDADDIHQEVFIRYLRKRPAFQSEEYEKAWLLRVTINCCRNLWKSAWVRHTAELKEDGGYPEHRIEPKEEEILETVKALPKKYRIVIHLFYYEDMSIEEISKIIKVKPSTIRTQLTRARKILKERLEER